ncbi:MAG: hypothetical protein ACI9Y7_000529 [Dokdonia sp.]|jgi:hypothetical protein
MKNAITFYFMVYVSISIAQTTILNPTFQSNTNEMDIISIKLYNDKTVVSFNYTPKKDGQMYINKGIYIEPSLSSFKSYKYYARKFYGNEFNKIYNVKYGESYSIILEFDKISSIFSTIDIREPKGEDGWTPWYWSNISIKNLFSKKYFNSNNWSTKPIESKKLPHGNYGHATLVPNQYSYWKYYIPSGSEAIFTLKNKSSTSNFDIYIYSDENYKSLIKSGVNSGIRTELISMPSKVYNRYVYIKLKNNGNVNSIYNLHAHFLDFEEIIGEAFVEAGAQYLIEGALKSLFGIEDNDHKSDSEKYVSRASSLILSYMKNENLGATSKNLAINELQSELRSAFGYGFWIWLLG